MSKKWRMKLVVIVLLFLALGTACSVDSQAAKKKNKVTWKLKKGTLTVYGKGKMPKSLDTYAMKKKQRKKVKKVVIKKGITTISHYAFKDMKNLKTAKIPSTVKKLGHESFAGTAIKKIKVPSSVRSIGSYVFSGTKLKKLTIPGNFKFIHENPDVMKIVAGNILSDDKLIVTFNTELKLDNVSLFVTKGYVVSKKDPKYCSVDGCIYTKDKKSLVRVPIRKKRLKIIEGCIEFCTQSVLHGIEDDDAIYPACNVSEIEIPASVKTIDSSKYRMKTERLPIIPNNIKKLSIHTRQLDGKSLAALVFDLNIDEKELMRQLPGQVIYRDGKYFSKDGVWLKKDPYKNWKPSY